MIFLMWKFVADYNIIQKIRHYVVTDLLKVKVIEAKNLIKIKKLHIFRCISPLIDVIWSVYLIFITQLRCLLKHILNRNNFIFRITSTSRSLKF